MNSCGNNTDKIKRFRLNQTPINFLDSDVARRALLDIISQIENYRDTQKEIDDIYDFICVQTVIKKIGKL